MPSGSPGPAGLQAAAGSHVSAAGRRKPGQIRPRPGGRVADTAIPAVRSEADPTVVSLYSKNHPDKKCNIKEILLANEN